MKKILFSIAIIFYAQLVFADNDVFVYRLSYAKRSGESVVVYCGITNNPERRAREHAVAATKRYNTFDTMTVFAGPMPREQALQEETNCINSNDIPGLYQTYPSHPTRPSKYKSDGEKQQAIAEYDRTMIPLGLSKLQNP
ncbi:MAG: hypothetical protein ACD_21C00232G0001 [uncultured bacterium]|nr:MAG: hypothetical protein ACD_21C00232G0001 [uncultured bacterium]